MPPKLDMPNNRVAPIKFNEKEFKRAERQAKIEGDVYVTRWAKRLLLNYLREVNKK